ncbi:hypothetical protein SeLEV6574_g08155, partial [Synchytrium endobioticum]
MPAVGREDDAVSVSSQVSLLDHLSKSERIIRGKVELDWNALPSELSHVVPLAGNSEREATSLARDPSRTHAVAATTRLTAADPSKPPVLAAHAHSIPANQEEGNKRGDSKKVYNFHNCQFDIVPRDDLIEGHKGLLTKPAEISGILNGRSPNREGVSRHESADLDDLLGRLNRLGDEGTGIGLPVECATGQVLPDPDMTIDDLSLPNDSVLSNQRSMSMLLDSSSAKHEGPFKASVQSSRPSFLNIETASHLHAELTDLSTQLQEKSRQLKQQARDLEIRERKIQDAEARVQEVVDKRLATEITKREDAWRKDVDQIIRKYDETLDDFAKENKRISSSMREVITLNRSLREQVTASALDIESRDKLIEGQSYQIRQIRDRNERLKNSLASEKATKPIVLEVERWKQEKEAASTKKFEELKRMVLTGKRPTHTTATQTYDSILGGSFDGGQLQIEESMIERRDNELDSAKEILINYLCEVHRTTLKYMPLAASIPDIAVTAADEMSIVARNVVDEVIEVMQSRSREVFLSISFVIKQSAEFSLSSSFWEFVLSFVRLGNLSMQQKHGLADVVFRNYISRQDSRDDTMIVLMQLVLLASVGQAEIIESVLDDLVSRMVNDSYKMAFLDHGGVEFMHTLLRRGDRPGIPLLASGILLHLCSDGDWLATFLTQCARPRVVNSCAVALGSSVDSALHRGPANDKMRVVGENVSVLLQKLSKLPSSHLLFKSNSNLMERLVSIAE